jgi:hypothetical protein
MEEVVVIALAADGVARAISLDGITAPWRERLERAAEDRTESRGRVSRFVAELVGCPPCTGWWASLAASALWPGQHRLRRVLSPARRRCLA